MYPILFTIGDLEFRVWGLMVMLGVVAGLWLSLNLAKRAKFNQEAVTDYLVYGVIAGLGGARIWEVLFSWSEFADNPIHALMLWEGGLSIQGAVVANVIFAIWYFRRKGLSFRKFADIGAPGLILGQAIGRIGCLLNGDAYGSPTNAWYGVVYQPGTSAYSAWGNTPLTPAEFFEAIIDMAVLSVLMYLFPRKKFDGQIALVYFILYSVARFALEFLRTDSLMVLGFKAAQLTSLATALAAGILLLWASYRKSIATN